MVWEPLELVWGFHVAPRYLVYVCLCRGGVAANCGCYVFSVWLLYLIASHKCCSSIPPHNLMKSETYEYESKSCSQWDLLQPWLDEFSKLGSAEKKRERERSDALGKRCTGSQVKQVRFVRKLWCFVDCPQRPHICIICKDCLQVKGSWASLK